MLISDLTRTLRWEYYVFWSINSDPEKFSGAEKLKLFFWQTVTKNITSKKIVKI